MEFVFTSKRGRKRGHGGEERERTRYLLRILNCFAAGEERSDSMIGRGSACALLPSKSNIFKEGGTVLAIG